MRMIPPVFLGACLALTACEGLGGGAGPGPVVDDVGSTSLVVQNDLAEALVVELDRGDPWVEPQVEQIVVAPGERPVIVTDWGIGGWLQPSQVLDRITIRREQGGEVVYERQPLVDAEWALGEDSSWEASHYTLVVVE